MSMLSVTALADGALEEDSANLQSVTGDVQGSGGSLKRKVLQDASAITLNCQPVEEFAGFKRQACITKEGQKYAMGPIELGGDAIASCTMYPVNENDDQKDYQPALYTAAGVSKRVPDGTGADLNMNQQQQARVGSSSFNLDRNHCAVQEHHLPTNSPYNVPALPYSSNTNSSYNGSSMYNASGASYQQQYGGANCSNSNGGINRNMTAGSGYTYSDANQNVTYGMNASPNATYPGYSAHPSNQGAGNSNGPAASPYMTSYAAAGGINPEGPLAVSETRNCQCGMTCPARTSNSAANAGRVYFCCPKPRDDPSRCRYFEWADGMNASGNPVREYRPNCPDNYGDRSFTTDSTAMAATGGGSGDRPCFTCGKTGHWSRDCPDKAQRYQGAGYSNNNTNNGFWGGGGGYGMASSSAAGGGGGGGSGTCFKCGQPGHWSRDCPNKGSSGITGGSYRPQGGGYGGGYGSYGGAGTGNKGSCYKCGEPGHFSNACPNRGRM